MKIQPSISLAVVSIICSGVDSFRAPFKSAVGINHISSSSSKRFQLNAVTDSRIAVEETLKTTTSKDLSSPASTAEHLSPLMATCESFVQAWREGLKGNQINLKSILSPKATWENPFVSTSTELMEGMAQFSNFLEEPSLTVFKISPITANQVEVDYHLSFWYPMAWKPRVIIPGKAIVTLSSDLTTISSVKEKWEVSIMDVFMKQVLPRFWDVWHVFCSPSPEYPPIKEIQRVGKVSFVELPQTVCMEVRWSGSSKYPGPPLLAAPSFSLFGALRTSKPKRDPFHTVLPIEVQSGKFKDAESGEDFKRSSWIFHVPTSLQESIMDKARAETVFSLIDGDLADDDEGENPEAKLDYQTQLSNDNINVMKCVTAGALRGQNVEFDNEMMRDFESKEKKEYLYKIQPARIIAQVDIKGEADPERINEALKLIRAAVESDGRKIFNKDVRMRSRDFDGSSGENSAPLLGLQLWHSKACFNMAAEPVMAIYEMQYGYRLTRVHVELEMN